jgi:polyphosphate kinase
MKDQKNKKLKKKFYEKELARLQLELVKLQEWVKAKGLKVVVLFEGRDAAGKGGVIKRITQNLNPRVCRVVALGTPTEKEKTQWRNCQLPVRSRSLTAVGTTVPALSM